VNITINPFQQLYFSDDTQSENNYVELFSDEVLQTAIHPVFQGGNVVLSGAQGCGKTMILSLLRPETRIAYWKQNKEFPVNEEMRNFVSAGINLTRSRITDLAQVTLYQGDDIDARELPLYFADFLNYWIVGDLLHSIELIGENPEIFDSLVDLGKFQKFVNLLRAEECWFDFLEDVQSLEELKDSISNRIKFYRKWVNGNFEEKRPPLNIRTTKTNIGEPIARAAECLRKSGMISDEVPVLIRIDQVDELHRAFTDRQKYLLLAFRKKLNRAFSARDARVHYRAGIRRYGWKQQEYLSIWGSEARLEERRDYLFIDMDAELFARGETKNSIFELFAEDTFYKRVKYYFGDGAANIPTNIVKQVFGRHPFAEKRIEHLSLDQSTEQIDRALALNSANDKGEWSTEWRRFLHELYRQGHTGMLNAVLAAAWGRQTGGGNKNTQHRSSPPPEDEPWRNRKWWRKERLDQAVLQLSTRSQQRFLWWGFNDIISLSGGNISVFLHICHRVWDSFLKNQSSLPLAEQTDLLIGGEIDKNIQSSGILLASNEWYRKLPEEPGGNSRQRLADRLGTVLNDGMVSDIRMSYPGGTGISIALSEYNNEDNEEASRMHSFMNEMTDYGVLVSTEHSSKSKLGGKRIKFYLNPILCPRYQLPEARTKEPRYWKMIDLYSFAEKASVNFPRSSERSRHSDNQTSFKFEEE
jgi:hypothetical protein